MLAASLVFGSFMTVLFMIVGVIGGWVAREYIMNYHDAPRLHPEFFDDNGNVIPDEVLALFVSKKVTSMIMKKTRMHKTK